MNPTSETKETKAQNPLENLLERYVEIIANDGRVFVGIYSPERPLKF